MSSIITHETEIPTTEHGPLKCIISTPQSKPSTTPRLIFTHGKGGNFQSPSIVNFTTGYAPHHPILCFQGSKDLDTRAEQFKHITTHHDKEPDIPIIIIGGRSLGARAAARAVDASTKFLILMSYPFVRDGVFRTEELLALPPTVKVLFASGDGDEMMDFSKLNEIRRLMKAVSWRVVVRGGNHGLDVQPRGGTGKVGVMIGRVAAEWVTSQPEKRESEIVYDLERDEAVFGGWVETLCAGTD